MGIRPNPQALPESVALGELYIKNILDYDKTTSENRRAKEIYRWIQ